MFSYRAAALAIAFLLAPALKTTAYLQLPGINGESTDTKHKHWIEIESVSMGVHAGGGGGSGTASGGHTGQTTGEIHVTKVTDQSSPYLMQAVASGKHFPTAEIDMSTVHYVMKDVILMSMQHTGPAGGGDGRPTESITMNYGSIKYEYIQQQPDTKGAPIAAMAPRSMTAPVTPAPTTPGTSMRAGAASASAVSAAPANSPAARLEAELSASLGPSTRSWVASEGRFLSQSNATGSQLVAAARQAAKGTFPGAPENVIEALTFLALMDAARANHNEAQFQAAINQVMPLTSASAGTGIASLH